MDALASDDHQPHWAIVPPDVEGWHGHHEAVVWLAGDPVAETVDHCWFQAEYESTEDFSQVLNTTCLKPSTTLFQLRKDKGNKTHKVMMDEA